MTVPTVSFPRAGLAPLVMATMASQALLVVLGPTLVAIGDDLGASVSVVSQARSITAGVAVAASLAITSRIDALGVPRLLRFGAVLAVVACAVVAVAPTYPVFLAAHALVGLAFAALLSAGFAGVAAFPPHRRAWAMGYVAAANALAWIVVNPIAGLLTGWVSWRVAYAVPAAIAAAALARPGAPVPAAPVVLPVRALLTVGSARRWIGAELIAYGAWTAFLTFNGAFFIQVFGVREAAVGWLLACGPAAYLVTATRTGRLVELVGRRRLVVGAAVLLAVLLPLLLAGTGGSVTVAVAVSCAVGLTAGVRTPAAGSLGLAQLPDHPGAMMAARTAATQLGYLFGAVVGGTVIAGWGYGALGLVLAAGMLASAVLVLRVTDHGPVPGPRPAADPSTCREPPAG